MKKINKNVLALIFSLLLALICAILLKFIVDKKVDGSLNQETVSYIVANTDLSAGSIVNPFDQEMYAIRSDIPAKFAQSNAITPDQAENIDGALLIANLKRGDILTWQSIDTDERKQLASRLLLGRRALTIPVDDQSSISSMLNPNDHIDLILTYQKEESIIAAPLLQNVRVLATGDSVSSNSNFSEDNKYSDGFTTITIDLAIDDVSKVTTALELGRISAVLRNPEDLSYTSNVVSLKTLQHELRLKTFQEPENVQNEALSSAYFDQLEELRQLNKSLIDKADNQKPLVQEQYSPPIQEQPLPPIEKPKSSIGVFYGNRTAETSQE